MIKFLFSFCLCFLVSSVSLLAQERVVSGTLTDNTGNAIPGVSIIVKGTTTGTTSDAQGQYSIKAPVGAVLIFSFIGYQSYEVVVTDENSTAEEGKSSATTPSERIRPDLQQESEEDTLKNRRGVARLSSRSPGFIVKRRNDYAYYNDSMQGLPAGTTTANAIPYAYAIRYVRPFFALIRYGKTGRYGIYVVDANHTPAGPVQLSFTSSLIFDRINRLPELQTQYAQGRPQEGKESWQAPETGEIFSWGPKIANLEYTGSATAYHPNGGLTNRGQGNGVAAQLYQPTDFFRTGLTSDNVFSIARRTGQTQFQVNLHRKQQDLYIPNAGVRQENVHIKVSRPLISSIDADYSLAYTHTESKRLIKGTNLASVVSGVFRTAPSFDNANGYSRKEALKQPAAFETADGSPRSYSPGNSDNPFWLASKLPDGGDLKKVIGNVMLKADYYNFSWNYTAGIDHQRNQNWFGLPNSSAGMAAGRFTNRTDKATTFSSVIAPSYRYRNSIFYNDVEIKINAVYDFSYQERNLDRQDAAGFSPNEGFSLSSADSVTQRTVYKARTIHEIREVVYLKYHDLVNLNFSNRSYFSSTYTQGDAFLPGMGASFNFGNLHPITDIRLLSSGKIYASYSENVQEAPLIYSKWHYNSTVLPIENYLGYVESQELAYTKGLQPEQIQKLEIGSSVSFFNEKINLEFNYFRNRTQNAVFPIYTDQQFRLQNGADIANRGYEWTIGFHTYGTLRWQPTLRFSRYNPMVKKLYSPENRIPLAGFTTVSTNLVAGEPVGVIYGSRFQRNEAGAILIDSDGFPMVDPTPARIGNPNPDWTGSLENSLYWKEFSLMILIDVRKGGDIWNGTHTALNYFGTSKLTHNQREIQNYIFEGIKEDGSPNDKPVDFANPANGLAGNRWVRYGLGGVAEEAMEDGSWIRLNEVTLTYNFSKAFARLVPRSAASISLTGKNLLLLTQYRGVDPSASLYGYDWGAGLDFFNLPSTRSYGFSINIKL